MNPINMMSDDLRAEISSIERKSPDGYTESYLKQAIEEKEDDAWELEQELRYLLDQQKMLEYTNPRALDLIEELTYRENVAKYNLSLFEVFGHESKEVAH